VKDDSNAHGFRAELRSFLRYDFLWWAAPILVVFLLFLAFALAGSGGESGFVYDLF
jgi:hypothetical protein